MEDHFNFPFIIWKATDIRILNRPLYHWETRIGSLGHPTPIQYDRKSAEDRFKSGISILDFIGVHINELSTELLLYAADYLESYLCQTAIHIHRSPEIKVDWIEDVYRVMLKNNVDLHSTIKRMPLHQSSDILFHKLEKSVYNENTFKEFLLNDYLSDMTSFLKKFKFNG